jgi:hypothetical protein
MATIEIKTLIDITNTGVTRSNQGNQILLDQHRNFITLIQCIELRSIIEYNSPPVKEIIDIDSLGFGNEYTGKHAVWTFYFDPDRSDVYADEQGNTYALLNEDLDKVPVVKNLTETINIGKAVFEVKNSQYKNIIIKAPLGNHQGIDLQV